MDVYHLLLSCPRKYSRKVQYDGWCGSAHDHQQGSITFSNGPITRSNIKALKEALNRLVLQVSAKKEIRDPLEH
jgi:hypothetical protein